MIAIRMEIREFEEVVYKIPAKGGIIQVHHFPTYPTIDTASALYFGFIDHRDSKLIYESLPMPIHTALSLLVSSSQPNLLRFSGLERFRESCNISLNRSLVTQKLHVSPIDSNLAFITLLLVFISSERSEAPVLGDDDLLTARELVLRAAKSFDGCGAICGVDEGC